MGANKNPDAILTKVVTLLHDHFGQSVLGIYLYGSQATGETTQESDWDIAVLLTEKSNQALLWQTGQEIATSLNMEIDLIDLLAASTVMQYEIITTGKRIDAQDEETCNAFEAQVMSAYLDLNEQRKEILEDIQKRKQVLS